MDDLVVRGDMARWTSSHGGVYVYKAPISLQTRDQFALMCTIRQADRLSETPKECELLLNHYLKTKGQLFKKI